jgi:AcrR family transcriptional regulator
MNMVPKRQYRMQARAELAEQTRQDILDSLIQLFAERWLGQITLADVAGRAGVTVQTVLRYFGSKDGLIAAAGDSIRTQVEAQRRTAPVGDVAGAIANLFDHYEAEGDSVLRALAQEGMYASIRDVIDRGRLLHYEWVERTFAPVLESVSGADRERLRAQLIAMTDVYVWKLLRRDLGLERQEAELALREMIDGVAKERRAR